MKRYHLIHRTEAVKFIKRNCPFLHLLKTHFAQRRCCFHKQISISPVQLSFFYLRSIVFWNLISIICCKILQIDCNTVIISSTELVSSRVSWMFVWNFDITEYTVRVTNMLQLIHFERVVQYYWWTRLRHTKDFTPGSISVTVLLQGGLTAILFCSLATNCL